MAWAIEFAVAVAARALCSRAACGARRRHARARHRDDVCPRIAYMPQGLARICIRPCRRGNLQFSRACSATTRPSAAAADQLDPQHGLQSFLARPPQAVGRHEQKLGLCCALIPSRTADSRRADHRRRSAGARPVLGPDRRHPRAAPANERDGGHGLHGRGAALRLAVAMDDGKVLDTGTPAELLAATDSATWKRPSSSCCPKRSARATSSSSSRRWTPPARRTSPSRRKT